MADGYKNESHFSKCFKTPFKNAIGILQEDKLEYEDSRPWNFIITRYRKRKENDDPNKPSKTMAKEIGGKRIKEEEAMCIM